MNYQYGADRQLTSGALQFLETYKITENKRNIYVNFILQIYKCVPLLHTDYYSCSLFDKESICNTFILKYNKSEGKPYVGDIISVTKINISILSDGEHRLYTCEETKLLEKGKKFLINPSKLNSISSKYKLDNSKSKNIFEENEETQKSQGKKEIINSQNFLYNYEIPETSYEEEKLNIKINMPNIDNINNNININNYNNINDKINKKNNNNNKENNNIINEKKIKSKSKKDIKLSQEEKIVKIKPQKKEDFSQAEKDLILDTLNLFIDDFQDDENYTKANQDKNANNNNNDNSNALNNKTDIIKLESKNYSLLSKPNPKKIIKPNNTQISDISSEYEFKYIHQINQIINKFHKNPQSLKFKIKCRVKEFEIGSKNYYMGCSRCTKVFKNREKICCFGAEEIPLYYFYVFMRDPSGVCRVSFHNKEGNKFMGMSAQKFKKMVEDNTPVGRIIFEEYAKDFYDNEFIICLQFFDDIKGGYKRYEAVNVERVSKKDRYDMINELKKILD